MTGPIMRLFIEKILPAIAARDLPESRKAELRAEFAARAAEMDHLFTRYSLTVQRLADAKIEAAREGGEDPHTFDFKALISEVCWEAADEVGGPGEPSHAKERFLDIAKFWAIVYSYEE